MQKQPKNNLPLYKLANPAAVHPADILPEDIDQLIAFAANTEGKKHE